MEKDFCIRRFAITLLKSFYEFVFNCKLLDIAYVTRKKHFFSRFLFRKSWHSIGNIFTVKNYIKNP